MKQLFNNWIRPVMHQVGFDIIRLGKTAPYIGYPPDFSIENIKICEAVKHYTMTSPERINSLIDAVRYVMTRKVGGAFVECGVWKGGSSMAIALTLRDMGDENRDIYLYDTFSGMCAPTDVDISIWGEVAHQKFSKNKISDDASDYCMSPLEEVKANLFSTGYDEEKIHFIKGKVEETIPKSIPKEIALLRLDTDWYESTKHELIQLFPLINTNGVLIIDDYGHWEGARKAVDEYISDNNIQILLNRIDYTGRIAIKT